MSDLFRFTRGRFLVDEEANLARRYVRFDVAALGRIAAAAVGARACTTTEKYSEGTYNKILLLTMDDGVEVIAKIPHPNAGHPDRTVASEVATMELAREVLDTPVPKVHAWSATATNGVGAAYILMEKVRGHQLTLRWSGMDTGQRTELLAALAQMQSRWAALTFRRYGSLYYAPDGNAHETLYTDRDGQRVANAKYTIGPTNSRFSVSELRDTVAFDRGPCTRSCPTSNSLTSAGSTTRAYMEGHGAREIACVTHAARFPKPMPMICGPGTYIPTREKKLRALAVYMELVKHCLPDESLSGATLWNPSVHNILVDPDAPGTITAVLDWQGLELSPLFVAAVPTDMSPYDGGFVPGLEPPTDPGVRERWGQRTLDMGHQFLSHVAAGTTDGFYRLVLAQGCSRPILRAEAEARRGATLPTLLGGINIFHWGETDLATVAAAWPADADTPSPFAFTAQERREIEEDTKSARRAADAMQRVHRLLGAIEPIGPGFMVSPGEYAQAKATLRNTKRSWFQQLAADGLLRTDAQRRAAEAWWPFDD